MTKHKEPAVIIKKVISPADETFHGGSWKIAYADFMTTLMTFFLVMWLVTIAKSQGERKTISEYYQKYNFFPINQQFKKETLEKVYTITQTIPLDKESPVIFTPTQIKIRLREIIESKLADLKSHITITEVEEGISIDIADPEGNVMFELGNPHLRSGGERILREISLGIKDFDNKLVLEGHTDAIGYPSSEYTNWELSTERASSARKAMEENGILSKRVAMVAGYASTRSIIRDDPFDPRNRRISILILYPTFIGTKKDDANGVPAAVSNGHGETQHPMAVEHGSTPSSEPAAIPSQPHIDGSSPAAGEAQ